MKRVLVLAVSLIASATAYGHYSFSAEFDAEKYISVTGMVSGVRYRNPHVQYFLDVELDGQVTR